MSFYEEYVGWLILMIVGSAWARAERGGRYLNSAGAI
jgi:hypothetical protein